MIILRQATIQDLALLQYWDQQPHVMAAHQGCDWHWEKELKRKPQWREQLIAELNQKPFGFVQIIDPHLEETHYWGDIAPHYRAIDLWIGEAENLNRGYGTELMKIICEHCFSNPEVKGILVDPLASNEKALRFYERLGFRLLEERTFPGEDPCRIYLKENQ